MQGARFHGISLLLILRRRQGGDEGGRDGLHLEGEYRAGGRQVEIKNGLYPVVCVVFSL